MESVNRKKILFLVTQSEMGGAQKYIYEVSKALAGRYEILVAAGEPAFAKTTAGKDDGELFEKLKNTRVQPVYLKQMRRAPNPYILIKAMAEIVRMLKKEKPDVLFLCSTTAGLLGSLASKIYKIQNTKYKIRVVYRIGGWAFNDPRPSWKNWLIFLAEKLTARFKDLIIVNSEYDRRIAIEKKIISPTKIVKIYNGIDVNSLNFLPREEARRRLSEIYNLRCHVNLRNIVSYIFVGCVANFYKTKGLEYLVEAAQKLSGVGLHSILSGVRLRSMGVKFIIIGEGRERPKIEALIKKYGLKNKVILAGRIPDAYKYLKAFDVFALPSLKEGFPWVILEAAAAGIPIVATKIGAIPEIMPEEFLVEPADAKALAKKISRMLEHPVLPKLKQKFSLQKMVEETEKVL